MEDTNAEQPDAIPVQSLMTLEQKIDHVKQLLSAPKSPIKLHDFIKLEIERYLSLTHEDNFPLTVDFTTELLAQRMSAYEECAQDLAMISAVIAYWGGESELAILRMIVGRASDKLLKNRKENFILPYLRWYPVLIILYHAGIAAIAAKNYKVLAHLFHAGVGEYFYEGKTTFVDILAFAIKQLDANDVFHRLSGLANVRAPLSEHIYKQIRPGLEACLFLGESYELAFDEFEILYVLTVSYLSTYGSGDFGLVYYHKFHSKRPDSPFIRLMREAIQYKDKWPPIEAGMFNKNYGQFEKVAIQYQDKYVKNLI